MSTFLGKYEAKADVKGRVFVPSVYRKLLPDGEKERIVMRKDTDNDCLMIYPEHIWNTKVQALQQVLDEWNPDDQLLLMQFVSDAEWLDIDSQGRILLAKRHLQSIQVDNAEILFVGMIDRFAIWGRSHYENKKMLPVDFANLLKNRMSSQNNATKI